MKVGLHRIFLEDVCVTGSRDMAVSPGLNALRIPKGCTEALAAVFRAAMSFDEAPGDAVAMLVPGEGACSGKLVLSLSVDGESVELEAMLDYSLARMTLSAHGSADAVSRLDCAMGGGRIGDSCFMDASDIHGTESAFGDGASFADMILGTELLDTVSAQLDEAMGIMTSKDGMYPSRTIERLEMIMNKHRLSIAELREYRDGLEDSRRRTEAMILDSMADAGDRASGLILKMDPSSCDDGAKRSLVEAALSVLGDPLLQPMSREMEGFYRCIGDIRCPAAAASAFVSDLEHPGACTCGRPSDGGSLEDVRTAGGARPVQYPYSVAKGMAFPGPDALERAACELESASRSVFGGKVPHKEEIAWLRSLRSLEDDLLSIRGLDMQLRLIGQDLSSVSSPDPHGDPTNNISACREAIRDTKAQMQMARESLLMSERRARLEAMVDGAWADAVSRAEALCAARVNEALGDEVMLHDGRIGARVHPGCDRWTAFLAKVMYIREIGAMRGMEMPLFVSNAGAKAPRRLGGILAEEGATVVMLEGM